MAAVGVSSDEDQSLVDRARGGDDEAFGVLVEKYQHRMVNVARHLMSNSADAEDVAQEAFLRAHRALRSFRGASRFQTWLYQIVTNTARSALGSRRGRPDAAANPSATPIDEGLRSAEDVERSVVSRDQVERALAALPDELREAVVLRDVEGLDYREIAVLLDVPIGTVESRIFRGRARLRASLRPAGETERQS